MKHFPSLELELELQQLFEGMSDTMYRIRHSSWFVALIDKTGTDPSLALQVGVALLADKPIIMVVPSTFWVSERLRQIAAAIVIIDDWEDPAQRAHADAEIRRVMREAQPPLMSAAK